MKKVKTHILKLSIEMECGLLEEVASVARAAL